MKKNDWFIVIVLQLIITILVLQCERWLCANPLGGVNMVDALTIWAAVITLVFLVFSVMGLMNIERKIDEVEKSRLMQETKFKEIEVKSNDIVQSIDRVKKEIIDKAQEQIKKITNDSTERINFFDRLIAICRNPVPDRQIMEFTNLLRETKEVKGIDFAYIYINRGHAYLMLRKMKEAFADFEKAIEICKDINKASAYSSMGYYYVEMKDYDKSIEYYTKALEANPESAPICMDLGNSLSKLGRFDEAEKYFIMALTYNPEMAEVYYNKASRIKDLGNVAEKEQMMAYLNKCIDINPNFIKAYINKACLLRAENKNEEAIAVLNKAIGSLYSHDFLMAVEQRGIAYRMTEQFSQAINDFHFVLTYEPDNIQNLSNLAITNLQMGNFMEASNFARKGLLSSKEQNEHSCDEELNEVLKLSEERIRDFYKFMVEKN